MKAIESLENLATLSKYAQVIPSEMMEELRASAQEKGISLSLEIAVRLTTAMAEPDLAQDNALSQQILRKEFTEQEAFSECRRKRESTLYLYEMEKLRLFLRFEVSLPRNIKESFMVIDVKEETKRIKAELVAEAKQAKQDQGE